MVIKVIKIITSALLVVILFTLVKERDLLPSLKNKLSHEVYTAPTREEVTTAQEEPLPSSEQDPKDNHTTVIGTTTTQVVTTKDVLPHVASSPSTSSSPYETLNEGTSDTDESYKPKVSPCVTPTGYTIGTFDSRFGISKAAFIQTIQEAGDLWGKASGKNLFYYDQHGALTINLIYDERQAKTQDINYFALEIANSKKYADELKEFYEQEKTLYTRENESLLKDGESFQIRSKAYGEKVATYNASGGASKIEYDAMTNELIALKKEAAELEERKKNLNATGDSINKKVSKYNEFVVYINSLIRQSNALGTKKFTEGRFSPSTETIDIYQYNDTLKLRRVIAHELGHALGINHNTNPYSIMFSVNSATTTELSKEDIESLRDVCSSQ